MSVENAGESSDAEQAQQFVDRLNADPIREDLRRAIVGYIERRFRGTPQEQEQQAKQFWLNFDQFRGPTLPQLYDYLLMHSSLLGPDIAGNIGRGSLRGQNLVYELLHRVVHEAYPRSGDNVEDNLHNLRLATQIMDHVRILRR